MGGTAGWTWRRRLAVIAAALFYVSLAVWNPATGSASLADSHHQSLIMSQLVDFDDDEHDSDFDFAPPSVRSWTLIFNGRLVYPPLTNQPPRGGAPHVARARDPPNLNV